MQQLTLVYMITYYTALCNGKGRGWKEIAELYNSGKKALYMIITYKVSSVLGDNPHLYLVVGKVGVFTAWQLVRLSAETERHRPIYHLWKTSHDIRGPMRKLYDIALPITACATYRHIDELYHITQPSQEILVHASKLWAEEISKRALLFP